MFTVGVLAAAVLAAGRAEAQGPGGGPGGRMGARQMEMLFQGITLSAAQVAQRDSIAKAMEPEMAKLREELMGGGGPPGPEGMAKMREMNEKQRAAWRAILTDEQKKVFDQNVANMPAGRGRPPGGGS
jgi:Spy/CpxP family protein refolding chaperone